VIDEVAVERVRLSCPERHWEQEVDYDVVRYSDPDGGLLEYYSVNGIPTMSPYSRDGTPLCPVCGRSTVAELLARRVVALPAQEDGRATGGGSRRTERADGRADVPLLDARAQPKTGHREIP
jgi:hypothetical protein